MWHQFCVCAFCSLRLSCRRSNMRCWTNVGLLLAHRLRRWANINPVLGYCVVLDATLNVSQRHRWRANINPASCRYYSQHEVGLLTTVEWILASTGDAAPTFTRHWVGVGLHCLTRSPKKTQCVEPVQTVDQNWTSNGSTSRVFWKCWQATFVFCTSPSVKILKLLPNWLSLRTI